MAHYVFVGSAGAYNADPIEPMHFEGDKRKSSTGHVAVENYLADQACHPWRHYAVPGCLVLKMTARGASMRVNFADGRVRANVTKQYSIWRGAACNRGKKR